jgi:hypothetical protein
MHPTADTTDFKFLQWGCAAGDAGRYAAAIGAEPPLFMGV